MKDEYYIDLRGKRYVLYKGLLAMAHEKGLRGIQTDLMQAPTPENGNMAISKAVVIMPCGEEHDCTKVFHGIGDASPNNVGKAIAPHVTRMSETRAKARALRDAVGVGETSLEELGPDDDSAPAPVTPLREAQQQAKPQYQPQGQGPKPASEKQLNYLKSLLKDHGDDARERLESKLKGKSIEEMNSNEARKWIEHLKGKTG